MVETPDIIQFPSGATRSGDAESERYDLISPIGLRRLAETYAEGAAKYGDRNWENGFLASVIFNHGLRHLNLWLDGDRSGLGRIGVDRRGRSRRLGDDRVRGRGHGRDPGGERVGGHVRPARFIDERGAVDQAE